MFGAGIGAVRMGEIMSGMLGADPEDLRGLAAVMDTGAKSLESTCSALRNGFSRTRWNGQDASNVVGSFHANQAPKLLSTAAMLRENAELLRRNADEQTRASAAVGGSAGAAGSGTSGSGPATGSGTAGGAAAAMPASFLPRPPVFPGGTNKLGLSVTHGPNSDSVSVTGSSGLSTDKIPLNNLPGLGHLDEGKFNISGGIKEINTVAAETSHTATTDTYKITSTVSTEGKVSLDLRKFGLEGTLADGQKIEYKITVPKGVNPLSINPNDPSSWPPGTTIQVDSSHTAARGLGLKYDAVGLDGSVDTQNGISQIVSKGGDGRVTVMSGPQDAITNKASLSVSFEDAKAALGASHTLSNTTLASATFDTSTADGRAALANSLANGTIPTTNGAGVSDAATVQRLDYSSSQNISLKVFDFEGKFDSPAYKSSLVETTYGDGTSEQALTVHDPGRPDMTASVEFTAAGDPVPGSKVYTYTVDNISNIEAQMLNTSKFSGFSGSGYEAGQNVAISLTASQLTEFQANAAAAHKEILNTTGDMSLLSSSANENASYYALLIQKAGGDTNGLISGISDVNQQANGGPGNGARPFPGTVSRVP